MKFFRRARTDFILCPLWHELFPNPGPAAEREWKTEMATQTALSGKTALSELLKKCQHEKSKTWISSLEDVIPEALMRCKSPSELLESWETMSWVNADKDGMKEFL